MNKHLPWANIQQSRRTFTVSSDDAEAKKVPQPATASRLMALQPKVKRER